MVLLKRKPTEVKDEICYLKNKLRFLSEQQTCQIVKVWIPTVVKSLTEAFSVVEIYDPKVQFDKSSGYCCMRPSLMNHHGNINEAPTVKAIGPSRNRSFIDSSFR